MATLETLRSELETLRDMTMAAIDPDGQGNPDAEADLEVLNELLAELAGEGGSIERKLDGYLERYAGLLEVAKAKEERAADIRKRAGTFKRRAEWVESVLGYFIGAFPQFAGRELPGGRLDLATAPPRVDVVDESLIPKKWRRIKKIDEPNKKEMLPFLKGGGKIRGVKLGGGEKYLRIRLK